VNRFGGRHSGRSGASHPPQAVTRRTAGRCLAMPSASVPQFVACTLRLTIPAALMGGEERRSSALARLGGILRGVCRLLSVGARGIGLSPHGRPAARVRTLSLEGPSGVVQSAGVASSSAGIRALRLPGGCFLGPELVSKRLGRGVCGMVGPERSRHLAGSVRAMPGAHSSCRHARGCAGSCWVDARVACDVVASPVVGAPGCARGVEGGDC